MAIPELQKKRVEAALAAFCERVPAHLRPKLAHGFRIRGNAVELYERRPRFDDATRFIELAFARFKYVPGDRGWGLQWRDRNGRWHLYEGFERGRRFGNLVKQVERDPTGIFFG